MVRVVRPGGPLVGADSLASESLREFHVGDIYNPIAPTRCSTWLCEPGCTPITVTVDERLNFTARTPIRSIREES